MLINVNPAFTYSTPFLSASLGWSLPADISWSVLVVLAWKPWVNNFQDLNINGSSPRSPCKAPWVAQAQKSSIIDNLSTANQ